MYNEKQRKWTPEQLAEAAQDALDNWEWDVEYLYPNDDLTQEASDNKKSIVEGMLDVAANLSSYCNDDGVLTIDRSFSDIWDWIHERMESEYANSLR